MILYVNINWYFQFDNINTVRVEECYILVDGVVKKEAKIVRGLATSGVLLLFHDVSDFSGYDTVLKTARQDLVSNNIGYKNKMPTNIQCKIYVSDDEYFDRARTEGFIFNKVQRGSSVEKIIPSPVCIPEHVNISIRNQKALVEASIKYFEEIRKFKWLVEIGAIQILN